MDVREQIANNTTDAVDSKDIEGIIDTNEELEFGGIITSQCADNAKDDGRPGRNVTRGGSDGNETSDGTGAPTDSTPLTFETVIKNHPCKSADGSRKIGNNAGHGCSEIAAQCTTTVEPEPTKPEENGSEDDVGNIVRSVVEFVSPVATALAQHDRVCKGGGTRRDVDRSTTGEIETSENKHPTVWVPCPAGDGIIDNGCPYEDEDAARKHSSSFSGSADGKCGSNCCEHTLEDGEGEIRNVTGLLC